MLYSQYKKQALADLKSYNQLKGRADTISHRIRFLKKNDLYSSAGFDEKVMHTKDSDSLMVRYISQLEEMENQLRYTKMYLANIDNALAMLSPKDRDILFAFYINRQRRSVTKLAEDTFSDRSWLYRMAQNALEKYIEAFYGVTKDNLPKDA